ATQLIQTYGSIEGIYAHLHEIRGKRRENLERARDAIALSRALVTLKRDADLPFSLEEARVRPPRLENVLPFFEELGFNRFQREVRRLAQGAEVGDDAGIAESAATAEPLPVSRPYHGTYTMVRTRAELDELVATLRQQTLIS